MDDLLTTRQRRLLLGILLFTFLVRLVTLGMYPLADTTEARYAEIGRKMAETGNWVTQLEDYGVPFWAKPPFSTWLTAATFKLLGVTEFAARLSSLVLMLAFCWLAWLLAVRQQGRDRALAGAAILATTTLTFITAGAVMTDASLGLTTMLSMLAFWRALDERGRVWGYLFFIGLGLGLLAKGPVAVVLTLLPIGIWTAWKGRWRDVWQRLPWIGGSLLALVIAAPWYLLAERRTPGFLNYFIVGEHIKRFTVSSWNGDLYGTPHNQPRGMIWLFWLAAALPWSLALLVSWTGKAFQRRRAGVSAPTSLWTAYLVCWAVSPMLFFTLAGNIMLTYVLTGLPAFALLAAETLLPAAKPGGTPVPAPKGAGAMLPVLALLVPALFLIAMTTVGPRLVGDRSQKATVAEFEELRTDKASRLIYFFYKPHSAKFYTRGRVIEADLVTVAPYLADGVQDFFAVRHGNIAILPKAMLDRLEPVWKDKEVVLYRERMDKPAPSK